MNKGEYNSLDIQTDFRKKTSTFLVIFFSFLCGLLYPVHRHSSFSTMHMKIKKTAGEWLHL